MSGLRKSYWMKAAAFISLAAALLPACGKRSDHVGAPQLLEPSAINYAYRPAEYGSIGNTDVIFGTVVPVSHCFFYTDNVRISELTVQVGDEVAPGDVLAYADIRYAVEQREAFSDSLNDENTSYDLNRKIADEELKKLKLYRQEALDAGDSEGAERFALSIATAEENLRYSEMLHNARVGELLERIAGQQETIDSGTLISDSFGRVTYIKDIAGNRYAGANENVVIVSDPDETYIELDVTVNDYKYSAYAVKYLRIGGGRYEAREIEYTPSELAVAKVRDSYPEVRIACPEGRTFNIGDTYPVYFREKEVNDVLIVGKDSLYSDDGGDFVYVRTSGQGREKRYVETGRSDDYYTEIVSGISEGEQIFYESAAVMPSDYIEYTAEFSDFEIANFSAKYELSDTVKLLQKSDYEGEILEICVSKGQAVAKGDLLYIIDSGEGRAALAKAALEIDREKEAYAADLRYLEEERVRLSAETGLAAECDRNILEYRKTLSVYTHERTLAALQKYYDGLHEGNDGNGRISVCSSLDGEVSDIEAKPRDKVAAGDHILTIAVASNPKMYVRMVENDSPLGGGMAAPAGYLDNIADVGEKVTFDFSQYSYTGECIGWTVGSSNADKAYLFTDEKGVHLTYSTMRESSAGFYVRLDDDYGYEMPLNGTAKFLYISMTDVVALPIDMIKEESGGKKFVWRVHEGQIVKQYVLVDEELADTQKQVVLSGINPGDVLAAPY